MTHRTQRAFERSLMADAAKCAAALRGPRIAGAADCCMVPRLSPSAADPRICKCSVGSRVLLASVFKLQVPRYSMDLQRWLPEASLT